MNDNKILSVFFIIFLVANVLAYILNPNNLFPGKADDILVCICGMIAIRSVYRIGFRKDIDE